MKKMSNIKKITMIICAGGLIIAGFICNDAITRLVKLDKETEKMKTSTSCEDTNLYYSLNNRNIYTYCLDSIKLNDKGEYVELKDLLKSGKESIENFIKLLDEKDTYKDGGSILYTSEINDITLLSCNTLDGNNDIYIGPKDMEYEPGFCKTRYPIIDEEEFEIIYHISGILPHNDEDYKYITIFEPNGLEVETVTISRELIKGLKNDRNYVFKFKSKKIPFESTIKGVFENAEVLNITPYKK